MPRACGTLDRDEQSGVTGRERGEGGEGYLGREKRERRGGGGGRRRGGVCCRLWAWAAAAATGAGWRRDICLVPACRGDGVLLLLLLR